MSIAEELEQLIALRVQGMLSEDEFNQAKHELLTRRSDQQLAPGSDALSKQEEYLRWQHELAQLERDWKREQEGYKVKVRGPGGGRLVPTKEDSLLSGGGMILMGLFFAYVEGISFFPVLFVGSGIIGSLLIYKKAKAYEQAEQHYQARRQQLASRRRL